MRKRTLRAIALATFFLLPGTALTAGDPPVLEGEIFTADQPHSLLDFTVRQVGFGRVRGTFGQYDAAITYVEDDLTKSSVSVVIDVESIDTGSQFRDDDLRSEDFFHAEEFPHIEFRSQRVEQTPDGYVLVGPLTIRDVTREVRIPFQVVSRKATDQWHNQRIVFDARLTLNRKDFGVVGPKFWNNLISEEVEIDISLAGRIFNYNNPFSRWKENSIGKALLETVEARGVEAAQQQAVDIWENHRDEYVVSLGEIYKAGMQLIQSDRPAQGLPLLEVAAELFQESAEPADLSALHATLAETYARLGERDTAAQNVEKALALDPQNTKARELRRHLAGGS